MTNNVQKAYKSIGGPGPSGLTYVLCLKGARDSAFATGPVKAE